MKHLIFWQDMHIFDEEMMHFWQVIFVYGLKCECFWRKMCSKISHTASARFNKYLKERSEFLPRSRACGLKVLFRMWRFSSRTLINDSKVPLRTFLRSYRLNSSISSSSIDKCLVQIFNWWVRNFPERG